MRQGLVMCISRTCIMGWTSAREEISNLSTPLLQNLQIILNKKIDVGLKAQTVTCMCSSVGSTIRTISGGYCEEAAT